MTDLPAPDTKHVVLLKAGDYEDRAVVDLTTAKQLTRYSAVMQDNIIDLLKKAAARALAFGLVVGAAAAVVADILGRIIF